MEASDAPSAASAPSGGGQSKAGEVRPEKTTDKKTEGLNDYGFDEGATDMDRTIFRTLEMLSKVTDFARRRGAFGLFLRRDVNEFRSLKSLGWDTEGVRWSLQYSMLLCGIVGRAGRKWRGRKRRRWRQAEKILCDR